jgi:hypothetical protein
MSEIVLSVVAFEFTEAQQNTRLVVMDRLAPLGSLPHFGSVKPEAQYAMVVIT